jgi:hypothetical protein
VIEFSDLSVFQQLQVENIALLAEIPMEGPLSVMSDINDFFLPHTTEEEKFQMLDAAIGIIRTSAISMGVKANKNYRRIRGERECKVCHVVKRLEFFPTYKKRFESWKKCYSLTCKGCKAIAKAADKFDETTVQY